MFKRLLSRLGSSEFLKNTATLASGTTIAQLVSIATAPVVYRLYDPTDYDVLGIYMSITGVLGVFSTMQYTQTVLLEKDDRQSMVAMWLNRYINVGFALLALAFVLLFREQIGIWTKIPKVSFWVILLPISIFFSGQNEIFRIWANRKKEYKLITLNSILTAITVPAFSIPLGLIEGPMGLFAGLLASQIVPALVLFFGLWKKYGLGRGDISFGEIKEHARVNRKFPIYSLPSEFINRFTNELPVFMLGHYAPSGAVGLYKLSVRMLGLPISLISNAISEVFRQRAVNDYNSSGSCSNIFLKTLRTLGLISIVPSAVIMLFGPDLFAFVFGEEWRQSGIFARILVILFASKLIVSPLSYMFYIARKIKEDMIWHIWMLVSNIAIFFFAFRLNTETETVLAIYAANYCVIYLVYLIRSYTFSKGTTTADAETQS